MDEPDLQNTKRKEQFKKTFGDAAGTVRRRDELASLRKDQRSAALSKRRRGLDASSPMDGTLETKEQQQPMSDAVSVSQASEDVTRLVAVLGTANVDAVAKAQTLQQLRTILAIAEDDTPADVAVAAGIVPLLISCLSDSSGRNAIEATWCLASIAAGRYSHTQQVLAAAPFFITFLGVNSPELQEQACWALGNLAGEAKAIRDVLLNNGVVVPLLQVLASEHVSISRTAAWALSNILKWDSEPYAAFLQGGVVPTIMKHFAAAAPDEGLLTELAWCLSYFSAQEEALVDVLIQAGVIPAVVSALRFNCTPIAIPVIRTLGNIVSCSGTQAGHVAAVPEVWPALAAGLSAEHRGLRKESAWTVANLAGTGFAFADTIVKSPLMPLLGRLLHTDKFDIAREAAFALYNIAIYDALLPAVMQLEVTAPVLGLVRVQDREIIELALRFIELIIQRVPNGSVLVEQADGIEALETLQTALDGALWAEAGRLVDLIDTMNNGDSGYDLDDGKQPAAGAAGAPVPPEEYPPWRNTSRYAP